jgi:hypothetical protein
MNIITTEFIEGLDLQLLSSEEVSQVINDEIIRALRARYGDTICPLPWCYDEAGCAKVGHCQFFKTS